MTLGCDDVRTAIALGRADDTGVARHVAACDACRAETPTYASVATMLASSRVPAPPPALADRVHAATAPLLARHAHAAVWRTMGRAVTAAVLPLPLLLLLDGYLLRGIYDALRAVLPNAVSLYLVANYTTMIAVLLTVAYGAIPLLADRQVRGRFEGTHA